MKIFIGCVWTDLGKTKICYCGKGKELKLLIGGKKWRGTGWCPKSIKKAVAFSSVAFSDDNFEYEQYVYCD